MGIFSPGEIYLIIFANWIDFNGLQISTDRKRPTSFPRPPSGQPAPGCVFRGPAPLRERRDLLKLAEALRTKPAAPGRQLHLASEVSELFSRHPWPGNICQLHNLLRTGVALLDKGTTLGTDHLPQDFLGQLPASLPHENQRISVREEGRSLSDLERVAIDRALEESQGNLSAAARQLGISRTTLYRKLHKKN